MPATSSSSASPRNTLPLAERLKSRKTIGELMSAGKSSTDFPFRLIVLMQEYDEKHPVKVAFSAPKARLKAAHDRTTMKRRMREAYRKNKHELTAWCHCRQTGLALLFISQCNTPADYAVTEGKIVLLLNRFMKQNEKPSQ